MLENWNGIISLLVACIELILFVNLLVFAEKNQLNKMAIIIIAILACYQLIEFGICGLGLNTFFISYLALAVISFLPPATLHFSLKIFNRWKSIYSVLYLPAAILMVYYAFIIEQFSTTNCTIFYAVYNYPLGDLFGAVYYIPVLAAMITFYIFRNSPTDKKMRTAVKIILATLIITSLPVVVAFILHAAGLSKMLNAMESVMCKFAFVYAFGLAIFALLNSKEKNAGNNS